MHYTAQGLLVDRLAAGVDGRRPAAVLGRLPADDHAPGYNMNDDQQQQQQQQQHQQQHQQQQQQPRR